MGLYCMKVRMIVDLNVSSFVSHISFTFLLLFLQGTCSPFPPNTLYILESLPIHFILKLHTVIVLKLCHCAVLFYTCLLPPGLRM